MLFFGVPDMFGEEKWIYYNRAAIDTIGVFSFCVFSGTKLMGLVNFFYLEVVPGFLLVQNLEFLNPTLHLG